MLKIGITGGIGSGKSTVCNIFEQLGIPVYYADLRARELMNTHPPLVKALKKEFGEDIYDNNGELIRPKLAAIVFNNKEKLERLNSLVHPEVKEDFRKWADKQTSVPYVMKEAALMFESGSYKDVDYIIVVSAPKNLRVQRVVDRDGAKRSDVLKRMAGQLTEKERLERTDFVLKNDGQHPLIPQVMELHKIFIDASQPLQ